MIQFILKKLQYKRWMNLCLLVGIFFLISIASCNPMYQSAALEKLLQNEIQQEQNKTGVYPGVVTVDFYRTKLKETKLKSEVFEDATKTEEKIEELFPLKALYKTHFESLSYCKGISNYSIDNAMCKMKIMSMSKMKNQISVIDGEFFKDGIQKDDTIEVMVSKGAMYKFGYLLGEEFTFSNFRISEGHNLKVRIVGVFEEKKRTSLYWLKPLSEYNDMIFMSELSWKELIQSEGMQDTMIYDSYYYTFDTRTIRASDIPFLERSLKLLKEEDGEHSDVTCQVRLKPVVQKYRSNQNQVITTMLILQVPILLLLIAFIFMVSKQMLDMEKGEIAILKSRGASKLQIAMTYLGQSCVLAVIGMILGIPGGIILCKLLGASNAFLSFRNQSDMYISVGWNVFMYAFAAACIGVSCMTFPVLGYAKVGIVEQKAMNQKNKQPLWRKLFLDIILFVFACYELYSFSHQKENLMKQMLEKKGLDPLLYISASLFILGAGFMMLRIIPLFIRLIFRIRKKHWDVVQYSSFLQLIRTSNQQIFISIFLILTVATGIFCANTARSVTQNLEERIRYNNGADIVLQESWRDNTPAVRRNGDPLVYEEPDTQKFDLLKGAKCMTKVLRGEDAKFIYNKEEYSGEVIGIYTKEFGETAWMKDGVLDKHWYHYLNLLADNPNGVLVSANVKKELHVNVGDTIMLSRKNKENQDIGIMDVVVCGFVDAFPGYVKKEKQYVFITNMSQLISAYGLTPYEIWIKNKGNRSGYIYDFVKNNNMKLVKFHITNKELKQMKDEPICQVTNGLLTLNFVVILILCMIGFLIYWILSIQQRELLFGIYRAMGMSMKEVERMLVNEHIFSSLTSVLSGAFIGVIATRYFIPLILLTFFPEEHNLKIEIVIRARDMVWIGAAMGVMFAVCLAVITMILKKMKITQVLKLGEE